MTKPDSVVAVPCGSAAAMHRLRHLDDVMVCASGAEIWVRGPSEPAVTDAFAALPGRHFSLCSDGLTPVGMRLVAESLPDDVEWVPLRRWLPIEFPAAGWAGHPNNKITISLVPSPEPAPATAVLTSMKALAQLTRDISIRFQHLKFARNENGEAFVMGDPVPGIPGLRFHVSENIAVPAGYRWTPAVVPSVVAEVFGNPDGIVLWRRSDHWEIIRLDSFAAVSRGACVADEART